MFATSRFRRALRVLASAAMVRDSSSGCQDAIAKAMTGLKERVVAMSVYRSFKLKAQSRVARVPWDRETAAVARKYLGILPRRSRA